MREDRLCVVPGLGLVALVCVLVVGGGVYSSQIWLSSGGGDGVVWTLFVSP